MNCFHTKVVFKGRKDRGSKVKFLSACYVLGINNNNKSLPFPLKQWGEGGLERFRGCPASKQDEREGARVTARHRPSCPAEAAFTGSGSEGSNIRRGPSPPPDLDCPVLEPVTRLYLVVPATSGASAAVPLARWKTPCQQFHPHQIMMFWTVLCRGSGPSFCGGPLAYSFWRKQSRTIQRKS